MSDIQDFTRPRSAEPIRFKVDDDVFEAVPEVPPDAVLGVTDTGDIAKLAGVDPDKASPVQLAQLQQEMRQMQMRFIAFLTSVLIPESAERFAERMRAKENPISLEQVRDITQWLIGRYSGRPTEPSTSSAPGRDGNGTNSMDIVPIGT